MKGQHGVKQTGTSVPGGSQSINIIRSDSEREINKEELQTLPSIHNDFLQTVKVVTYKILSYLDPPLTSCFLQL